MVFYINVCVHRHFPFISRWNTGKMPPDALAFDTLTFTCGRHVILFSSTNDAGRRDFPLRCVIITLCVLSHTSFCLLVTAIPTAWNGTYMLNGTNEYQTHLKRSNALFALLCSA